MTESLKKLCGQPNSQRLPPRYLQASDCRLIQVGESMYNRYIPQPDGSHQRNRVPEQKQITQKKASVIPEIPHQVKPHCQPSKHQSDSVIGLLRNLLPKNLDSGDLIIILLLLLMANDCEENRNHALLTLALYFFL